MDRTPEQTARVELLFELRKSMPMPHTDAYAEVIATGVRWIHFTDWYGHYDLERLEGEGLLTLDVNLRYQPIGDWHDFFPPDAYRLSEKAIGMLYSPGVWIHEGKWESKS